MKIRKTTKILLLSATLPCLAALTPLISLTSCNKNTPDSLEHIMRAELSSDTNLTISQGVSRKMLTDLSISTDGKTWTKITQPQTLHFKSGEKIYFAGNNPTGLTPPGDWLTIKFTNNDSEPSVKLCGSVMSLLGDYKGEKTALPNIKTFDHLFDGSTAIKEIDKKFLPATQLSVSCYNYMFAGCTGLKSLPVGLLPAQMLSPQCYLGMFHSCTGLTSLESGLLPSDDLADECYSLMFTDCTNLKEIPSNFLPAKKMAKDCYSSMFELCGFVTLPENLLPSTQLAKECYFNMFADCKKLKNVPTNLLPSTQLEEKCYKDMFNLCTSLSNLPNLPAKQLANDCYGRMFCGCTSLTSIPDDFVFNAEIMGEWSCELMFADCTNIKTVKKSLFNNLKQLNFACLDAMFANTAITEPVDLPDGVELAEACFQEMYRFTKLTRLPKLNYSGEGEGNGGLQAYCFRGMFRECDLTNVNPNEFKALNNYETLKIACFEAMFQNAKFPDTVKSNMSTYFDIPATNAMPWCYKDMFRESNMTTLPKIALENLDDGSLSGTFAGTHIRSIAKSDLTIPKTFKTDASESCKEMFMGCSSLETIDKNLLPNFESVPAFTFSTMFADCKKLKKVCDVKATKYGESACENMFRSTGITVLDECIFNKDGDIADGVACFDSMFADCEDLVTVTNDFLPFETLEVACYYKMFMGCLKLTTAPNLPATTLVESCYESMFEGCSSLEITTEETGATKFLQTPADMPETAVLIMFRNTKNPPTITPEPNKTYYYKNA